VKRLLAGVALALLAFPRPALAQAYPVKPIRLIVPLAPGGGADTLGRYLAKHLTDILGQQVIVDNRPGGGGLVGGELVARAPPDGYTLLVGGSGQIVTSLTHGKLDVRKDYTPIAMAMEQPSLLVAHTSLPIRSVADLVKLSKARRGELNYASAGTGSTGHLAMEMFKTAARIELVHVPYKGAGAALTDVMSGQVPLLFSSPLGTLPFVKAGRLRALAVSGTRRMSGMPEIPTVAESGVPGFHATFFLGLLGPAALPRDIVTRLNTETVRIVQRRDVRDWLAQQGAEPVTGTPEDFAARIRTDLERTAKVVREAGLRLD
jgi:tripartite-type tricarboxylate transporter receptor subunit TctC